MEVTNFPEPCNTVDVKQPRRDHPIEHDEPRRADTGINGKRNGDRFASMISKAHRLVLREA